ncbi:MAG: hypothetical protein V1728_05830 [Candidatus Micrarchaeota archaeon]
MREMYRVERWLKQKSSGPMKLIGEIVFGSWGEDWEERRVRSDLGE